MSRCLVGLRCLLFGSCLPPFFVAHADSEHPEKKHHRKQVN